MCQGIMELSNALIYGDRLRCGSPEIAHAKLIFSSLKSHSWWIKEVRAFYNIIIRFEVILHDILFCNIPDALVSVNSISISKFF